MTRGYNPNREPAGDEKGGQFASSNSSVNAFIRHKIAMKNASMTLTKTKKFISKGYGEYQSSGVEYAYQQVSNPSNNLNTLSNGDAQKKYTIEYQGREIGTVQNYSAYLDSKTAGRRYVNTRKNVARWRYSLTSGNHIQSYGIGANNPIIPGSFDEMGFRSLSEAMQSLANTHKRAMK